MRLRIFTLCFLVSCLLPPILNIGVYKNDSGRWVFSTPYAIGFLIVSFLFIHEFIHVMSHEGHEESHEGAKHQKEKPKS